MGGRRTGNQSWNIYYTVVGLYNPKYKYPGVPPYLLERKRHKLNSLLLQPIALGNWLLARQITEMNI